MKIDPVTRFNSQIRGVPIEVESELQVLLPKSGSMALDEKEFSFDDDCDEADGYVTTVNDDSITDEVNGEQINYNFQYLIDAHEGVTGSGSEKTVSSVSRNAYKESIIMNLMTYMVTQTNQQPYYPIPPILGHCVILHLFLRITQWLRMMTNLMNGCSKTIDRWHTKEC